MGDPNQVVIGGAVYAREGSFELPAITATAIAHGSYTTYTKAMPYAAPAGWTFEFFVLASPSAFGHSVANADAVAGASQRIRISTMGTSASWAAGIRIGWRIVPV